MGQFPSRQATSRRLQDGKARAISPQSRSHRKQPSNVRPESLQTPSKVRTRNPDSARTHDTSGPQAGEQSKKNRPRQLREGHGNIAYPKGQTTHGRSKGSKGPKQSTDHSHQRPRKAGSGSQQPQQSTQSHRKARSISQPPSRQSKPPATKECLVCTNTRSLQHFSNRPPTESCVHDTSVCRRCLRIWIQSESSIKIWNEINCPICAARMQYDDIREFAPKEVSRRYAKLTTKAAYESIPNFRWCITKGCKSGQVHPPGTAKFKCEACKKSHCVPHCVGWHKGETCKEYDYRTNKKLRKQEELASKKTIERTTKKCPGCKRSIEKSFGCDHMTCKPPFLNPGRYRRRINTLSKTLKNLDT
jgi:hypothetical protein